MATGTRAGCSSDVSRKISSSGKKVCLGPKKNPEIEFFYLPKNDSCSSSRRFCPIIIIRNATVATLNHHYPRVTVALVAESETEWYKR